MTNDVQMVVRSLNLLEVEDQGNGIYDIVLKDTIDEVHIEGNIAELEELLREFQACLKKAKQHAAAIEKADARLAGKPDV